MGRKKILIVDDHQDSIFVLENRLDLEGFKVITALDGESCISLTKECKPSLILLDVMMPNMSGYEVCKVLSNVEETKEIPIILLTALTSPDETAKGFEAGAFDFIKKPFSRVELLARIKSALRFSETKKLLLDLEKVNTFSVTIKKTNHEIKQPLTLISLAATAIKREVENEELDKDVIIKRVQYIEDSVTKITKTLEFMKSIQSPDVKEYLENLNLNYFVETSERLT
ncbi:MAG: response regulator [Ignavibacteriae bacterium]|nr:response regulator [Ignavibacteriota bacterium]